MPWSINRGGKTPGVFLFDAYVVVIATAQSAQSVVGRAFLLIHTTSFMCSACGGRETTAVSSPISRVCTFC